MIVIFIEEIVKINCNSKNGNVTNFLYYILTRLIVPHMILKTLNSYIIHCQELPDRQLGEESCTYLLLYIYIEYMNIFL